MTVEGMMAGGRRPENSHGGGRTQPQDRLGAMGWEHRCSTPRKRVCAYLVLLGMLDSGRASLKNIERGRMPVLRGVALGSLDPLNSRYDSLLHASNLNDKNTVRLGCSVVFGRLAGCRGSCFGVWEKRIFR